MWVPPWSHSFEHRHSAAPANLTELAGQVVTVRGPRVRMYGCCAAVLNACGWNWPSPLGYVTMYCGGTGNTSGSPPQSAGALCRSFTCMKTFGALHRLAAAVVRAGRYAAPGRLCIWRNSMTACASGLHSQRKHSKLDSCASARHVSGHQCRASYVVHMHWGLV